MVFLSILCVSSWVKHILQPLSKPQGDPSTPAPTGISTGNGQMLRHLGNGIKVSSNEFAEQITWATDGLLMSGGTGCTVLPPKTLRSGQALGSLDELGTGNLQDHIYLWYNMLIYTFIYIHTIPFHIIPYHTITLHYTYTHIHTHIHTHTHTYTHIHTHTQYGERVREIERNIR